MELANASAFTPLPSASRKPISIWRIDYNATVAKEAAMGWQGLGYVLGLNAVMFLVAFVIFQLYAKSSRFSLFRFRTSTILSAHRDTAFTLKKWVDLLWRTPIRDTDVELQLGPEGTFYLLYELYICKMLAALSIYAFIVLLPLYLSIGKDNAAMDSATDPDALPTAMPTLPTATAAAAVFLRSVATSMPSLALDGNASSSSPMPQPVVPGAEDKWWSFTHATIRSIPNQSPYLWIPVATCYIFTIAFMVLFQKLSQLSSIPSGSSPRAEPAPTECKDHGNGNGVENGGEPGENDALLQKSPSRNKKQQQQKKKQSKPKDRTHLIGMQPSELSLRSLFINRGLPKTLREERFLYIMHEVFPGYVEDVSVVLNMAEFHKYQKARRDQEDKLQRAKILFEKKTRKEPISWSLWLFPGSMKFPYLHRIFECNPKPFPQEEHDIQTKIKLLRDAEEECLQRLLRQNNGAGRAFIIFKNPRLRARFVRRVRNQSIMSILARFPEDALPRMVRYVRELGVTRWHMSTAPEPDDVDWNSVSFPFVKRTIVVLLVNLAILVMLFVFTSPIAVTSAISNTQSYTNAASSVSDFVASVSDLVEKYSPQMAKMMVSYIPTLILVVINSVLLNVLQSAGRIQPIATDSAKERMILRTASVYLIFNTIFVPSLAFVSIDAVLLYLNRDGEVLDILGTLFLHNSGIFYVYYVLQRCFLGTAVNLLRVSEYAKFSWEKPRAVTPREHVESVEAWPFFTGTQMAIQISMITIVLTFSTVVPLILPIGMLYFGMQHAIDKYSLLHVRPRIKGRGSIARTATHATIFSLLIYQGAMSGFFIVRGTKLQSTCILALLMITYILCLWWYIRDKERAFVQTTRGHYHQLKDRQCNHAHHNGGLKKLAVEPQPIESLADAVAVAIAVKEEEEEAAAVQAVAAEEGGSTGEPEPPQQQDAQSNGDADADDMPPIASPKFNLKPEKASLLNETSALLMLAAKREVENADKYERESDLYREPALRNRNRTAQSIRSMDSRDFGTNYGSVWRRQSTTMVPDAPRSATPSTIPEEALRQAKRANRALSHMKRALSTARAFSQQALRQEAPASGRGVSGASRASSATAAKKPLELDGRPYLLPTLTLSRTAARKLGEAHVNFQTRARKTPIVLDLQLVSSDGSPHAQPIKKHELRAEIEQLQNVGFVPVGITNASEDVKQLAAAMNLPCFISTRLHVSHQSSAPETTQQAIGATMEEASSVTPTTEATQTQHHTATTTSSSSSSAEEVTTTATPTAVPATSGLAPMVVTSSVRSGQQIFAQNRSLVILGNVNSGAEVLADEDVFVMGALKGRALAGIGGNVSARIICQSFDAELISIAHHFTTCDELDERKHRELRVHKPTVVSLQENHLHFQSTH